MDINSDIIDIQAPASKAFDFISNFNNFEKLLPPQVTDWKSTEDSCSFNITGMATLAMRIKEKNHPTLLLVMSEAPSPFPFELRFDFEDKGENLSTSKVSMSADMPMMVAMMAKKPLQNFVNMVNQQLKTFAEKEQ